MFLKFRDKYDPALGICIFQSQRAGIFLDRNSGKSAWNIPNSKYNGSPVSVSFVVCVRFLTRVMISGFSIVSLFCCDYG